MIWLTPQINSVMEQKLLSVSANAIRSCMMSSNCDISFERIHLNAAKWTPSQIMLYQSALKFHKTLNFDELSLEAVTVLNQMTYTTRQLKFEILRDNWSRIGMNTTANKFYVLCGKIGLDFLNFNFVHFKKLMKIQFLKYGKT